MCGARLSRKRSTDFVATCSARVPKPRIWADVSNGDVPSDGTSLPCPSTSSKPDVFAGGRCFFTRSNALRNSTDDARRRSTKIRRTPRRRTAYNDDDTTTTTHHDDDDDDDHEGRCTAQFQRRRTYAQTRGRACSCTLRPLLRDAWPNPTRYKCDDRTAPRPMGPTSQATRQNHCRRISRTQRWEAYDDPRNPGRQTVSPQSYPLSFDRTRTRSTRHRFVPIPQFAFVPAGKTAEGGTRGNTPRPNVPPPLLPHFWGMLGYSWQGGFSWDIYDEARLALRLLPMAIRFD